MAESSYTSDMSSSTTANSAERPRTEVLNEKLGAFVKFTSKSFVRARQYTVERLGRADSVTSYDTEFETLCQQVDGIKQHTERILAQVESMIQPNPGLRLEGVVYSKLERTQPHHSSPHELLGVELARAGNEFGPDTQYGGYLIRCGQVETKIGISERRFQNTARSEVVTSLRAFLEVDIKNIIRERKTLQVLRLDLDASKSQAKKAQAGEKLQQAESQLRSVQADYDIQMEKVRSNMEKIVHTHVNNLGHIKSLMSAIRTYHTECLAHLDEIGSDLPGSSLPVTITATSGTLVLNGIQVDEEDARKARVLYDYESEDNSQISFFADQVIVVYPIDDDDDYYMAQVDDKVGKIPAGYLELL